eukprot:TRINITY_DN3034_c0_g3_i4.p1 TRINITY_DN3034_c0_g3~~TRINITY_DN3034_c0_g3_i4.p1  ORF type:complete len:136 (+),score=12.42 TRINITY_DN3034_c0_g3_i4:308-715(+)
MERAKDMGYVNISGLSCLMGIPGNDGLTTKFLFNPSLESSDNISLLFFSETPFQLLKKGECWASGALMGGLGKSLPMCESDAILVFRPRFDGSRWPYSMACSTNWIKFSFVFTKYPPNLPGFLSCSCVATFFKIV